MENKKEPKVIIIILNYNQYKDTHDCLKSVYKLNYLNYDVIVIDNQCNSKSHNLLKQTFPSTHFIKNNQNNGFSRGNNQGIRIAFRENADYVWLLNNDTIVPSETLSILVKSFDDSPTIAMVSPLIFYFYDKDRVQFGGSKVNWNEFTISYPINFGSIEISEYQNGVNTCLWGTALLIKKTVIEKIGLLDERFFAYWEDTEYCLRAIRFGYRNKVETGAIIYHKTKAPLNDETLRKAYYYYYITRNEYFLWQPFINFYKMRRIISKSIMSSANCFSKGSFDCATACVHGMVDGLKGNGGVQKETKKWIRILTKIILIFPYLLANLINTDLCTIRNQIFNIHKKLKIF